MKFSKTKPTVPGFYFIKHTKYPDDWTAEDIKEHEKKFPYTVVRVIQDTSLLGHDKLVVLEYHFQYVSSLKNVLWAGPIEEPVL
jgi:hypothetical protein